jgi:cytidyltransferase-like protein
MDTVVIYPGRFHPFHKGHKSVYDALVKRFGKNRVYIATSNKVDPPKSPFTFDEKRAMMALTGVDPSRVVQVKNPYQATEITDNFDPQNTIALFAVSDKDMAEDPRFSFKPRKDGQPSYYQPASKDMQGFDKHGYIVTVPTLQFNVLGKPMRSASEFRANFARADNETQKAMITDLFGQYDPKTHNTMAQKIVEQLIRADEILDKLIEMGADDCYILEACIRVDTLVENINMKQRKQTLYQAIMEGGHTLPVNEAELACPVAAGDLAVNTENRDRTIKQFNYGPLNVDIPGDYWEKIADYWDTTEQAAKASNCGNCVAFDISERMKDCLPGDTFDDDGELGYCWMHHFKCHSARSCHTWAKGGPIKTEKESAEWQGKAFGVKEEITDFNTEDPMNSVIAIRGIGTMSISSALEKVSEMAMDIAKLGAMKDAKNVQDNLPRYMDLLATYNESIQEAYRELAQQRKRGGTASRGIDKDISEAKSDKDHR